MLRILAHSAFARVGRANAFRNRENVREGMFTKRAFARTHSRRATGEGTFVRAFAKGDGGKNVREGRPIGPP